MGTLGPGTGRGMLVAARAPLDLEILCVRADTAKHMGPQHTRTNRAFADNADTSLQRSDLYACVSA